MIKTLQQAPFLRLTLFFISGILVAFHYEVSFSLLVCLGIIAIILLLISPFVKQYAFRWIFGTGLFFLCFSIAGLFTQKHWAASEWEEENATQNYLVEIIDEPVQKPKTRMCKVRIKDKKAIIYIPTDSLSSALLPGDILEIRTRFEKPYPDYLRKKGIAARGFVSQDNWKKQASNERFNLRYLSLGIRRKLLTRLREIIPEEQSFNIAAALIINYKDELSPEARQTFAATGSSHVLSVSGFHFSTIYAIFYFLLSFLGNSRRAKIIRQSIILPVMWLFAFITGLAPPVVRAGIMLSLWAVSDTFFVRAFTLNTLAIAAFFMLLYNPLYLFDVGFQLSFSAVFAILTLNPHLVILYESRNPIINYAWQLSCVSTSAQLGTMPLSIFYFNQFPLTYLLTNLFIIPLVSILMALIPLSLLFSYLFPGVLFFGILAIRLLEFMMSGLRFLESVPYGLISGLNFSILDSLFVSLYLVLFTFFLIKKRIAYLYFGLFFACVQVFYYFCLD